MAHRACWSIMGIAMDSAANWLQAAQCDPGVVKNLDHCRRFCVYDYSVVDGVARYLSPIGGYRGPAQPSIVCGILAIGFWLRTLRQRRERAASKLIEVTTR